MAGIRSSPFLSGCSKSGDSIPHPVPFWKWRTKAFPLRPASCSGQLPWYNQRRICREGIQMRNTFDRFNGRHQDYQAARPSYAQEFLDWLGELYAPPERYTAADIGSGTGKLSAQLLAAASASAAWSRIRICGGRRRRFWAAIPGSPPQMERTMIPGCRTGPWTWSQRPRPSTGSTVLPLRGSAAGSCAPAAGASSSRPWRRITRRPTKTTRSPTRRAHAHLRTVRPPAHLRCGLHRPPA